MLRLHEALAVPFAALRYVLLKVPGSGAGAIVELLEYQGAERMPAASRPSDPGNGHLCLQVSDATGLHRRLRAMGYGSRSPEVVAITAGGNAGGRIVYVGDPDGYWVELLERLARESDAFRFDQRDAVGERGRGLSGRRGRHPDAAGDETEREGKRQEQTV